MTCFIQFSCITTRKFLTTQLQHPATASYAKLFPQTPYHNWTFISIFYKHREHHCNVRIECNMKSNNEKWWQKVKGYKSRSGFREAVRCLLPLFVGRRWPFWPEAGIFATPSPVDVPVPGPLFFLPPRLGGDDSRLQLVASVVKTLRLPPLVVRSVRHVTAKE